MTLISFKIGRLYPCPARGLLDCSPSEGESRVIGRADAAALQTPTNLPGFAYSSYWLVSKSSVKSGNQGLQAV